MEPESSPRRTEAEGAGGEDRLSALSDDIIHRILSFIPSTVFVARTSVLSKRWRNLWTQHPNLRFITGQIYEDTDDRPYNLIVDRCLRSFNPPSLNCFITYFWLPSSGNHEASYHTLDRWLRFAALRSVRTLDIRIRDHNTTAAACRDFKLPSSIFLCGLSLVDLLLHRSTFPLLVDGGSGGGFPNLKRLDLSFVRFSDLALARLLSACPFLEALHLQCINGVSRVEIPNLPRLTHLCIIRCRRPRVTILASNITTIDYRESLCLLNWPGSSPALTGARLDYPFAHPENYDDWLKTVGIFSDVSRLEAYPWLFKFSIPNGFFKNLRQLSCIAHCVTSSFLCSLARGLCECPVLEDLFLNLDSIDNYSLPLWSRETDISAFLRRLEDEYEQGSCAAFKDLGDLDYSSCRLKTITIKPFRGTKIEFQLAEFLLEKAILLEEFILYDLFNRGEWELQEAFATIPRASSKVRLIFKGNC